MFRPLFIPIALPLFSGQFGEQGQIVAPPEFIACGEIEGTPLPGAELTYNAPTVVGDDVVVTIEWYKNGIATGVTGLTYAATADGDVITIEFTATNAGGSDECTSPEVEINALFGVPTTMDLRTHRGDKVPFGISPVDGDPNNTWIGLVGTADQSVETRRPLTKMAGDGTPYLDFDGVDDWMSIGDYGGVHTYTALIRSKVPLWNSYFSICDTRTLMSARWGLFEIATKEWHASPYPQGVRYNGLPATSPFVCDDPEQWNIITVTTDAGGGSVVERGLMQLQDGFFGNVEVIGFFLHDGTPTTDMIEAVESYYELLKPVP